VVFGYGLPPLATDTIMSYMTKFEYFAVDREDLLTRMPNGTIENIAKLLVKLQEID
jgi:hypothetical protein